MCYNEQKSKFSLFTNSSNFKKVIIYKLTLSLIQIIAVGEGTIRFINLGRSPELELGGNHGNRT